MRTKTISSRWEVKYCPACGEETVIVISEPTKDLETYFVTGTIFKCETCKIEWEMML